MRAEGTQDQRGAKSTPRPTASAGAGAGVLPAPQVSHQEPTTKDEILNMVLRRAETLP